MVFIKLWGLRKYSWITLLFSRDELWILTSVVVGLALARVKLYYTFNSNTNMQSQVWSRPLSKWLLHWGNLKGFSIGSRRDVHVILNFKKNVKAENIMYIFIVYQSKSIPKVTINWSCSELLSFFCPQYTQHGQVHTHSPTNAQINAHLQRISWRMWNDRYINQELDQEHSKDDWMHYQGNWTLKINSFKRHSKRD